MESNSAMTVDLATNSTNISTPIFDSNCPPYFPTKYLTEKFWIVLIVGTSVCLCGIAANVMLVASLSEPHFKQSHVIYWQVLAGIDICILCAYIAVFSVSILYDHLNLPFLYIIWVHYVPYLNYVIRVVMLASTYLIVAATAERLIEVTKIKSGKRHEISSRTRKITIFGVLLFAVIFRLPVLWEIKLGQNPFCAEDQFNHWELGQTELAKDQTYRTYYVLYAVSFVRTFAPFFTLCIMNFLIIFKWKAALNQPVRKKGQSSEKRFWS